MCVTFIRAIKAYLRYRAIALLQQGVCGHISIRISNLTEKK